MNETSPPVETPITVTASAHSEQLGQAVRTLLIALGGYLAGKGYLSADIVAAVVPVIMIGGPLLWGQFRVLKTHAQRVTMAGKLPDRIATVEGQVS